MHHLLQLDNKRSISAYALLTLVNIFKELQDILVMCNHSQRGEIIHIGSGV